MLHCPYHDSRHTGALEGIIDLSKLIEVTRLAGWPAYILPYTFANGWGYTQLVVLIDLRYTLF